MKDREVMELIKEEVRNGSYMEEDTETIFNNIQSKVSDSNQLARCLNLFMWVDKTCDAICNPRTDFEYFLDSYEESNVINFDDFLIFDTDFTPALYRKCLKYMVKELRSRKHDTLYRVSGVDFEAFYINKTDAKLQQFCLQGESIKVYFKKVIQRFYHLDELYPFFCDFKHKSVNALNITLDEFLILQAFKRIDADTVTCTNETDKAIALFHFIHELGLEKCIDFKKMLADYEMEISPIEVEEFNLLNRRDLKKLFEVGS